MYPATNARPGLPSTPPPPPQNVSLGIILKSDLSSQENMCKTTLKTKEQTAWLPH